MAVTAQEPSSDTRHPDPAGGGGAAVSDAAEVRGHGEADAEDPQTGEDEGAKEGVKEKFLTYARRLGPTGPLAVVALVMPPLGGFLILGTLNIVGPWLMDLGLLGLAIYIVGFAVFAGLALLPTYSQALLGGWAFGLWGGIPAALCGFFGGALIGYLIASKASGTRVTEIINEKPKWAAVRDALIGQRVHLSGDGRGPGFWKVFGIVTLVRVPPNSPFALTNLVMASVGVPRLAYLLGTLVGMAPRTIAAVYIASEAETMWTGEVDRPWWLFAAGLVGTFAVLGVIGYIANKALARVTRNGVEANGEADGPASEEPLVEEARDTLSS